MKYLLMVAGCIGLGLAQVGFAGTPTFEWVELEGALGFPSDVSANYVAGQINDHPILWDLHTGAIVQDLAGLVGTQGSIFLAVNDLGAVTGNVANTPFVWSQANGLTILPATFQPSDINNAGIVVGRIGSFPAQWDSVNGVQQLSTTNGNAGTINEAGIIGGQVGGLAAVWIGGVETLVPFAGPPAFSFVTDIDENGIAIGKYNSTITYQWDVNSSADAVPFSLPIYVSSGGMPRGLNTNGAITVGGTDPNTTLPNGALMVPGEGWISLNSGVVPSDGTIVDITSINEEGWFAYFSFGGDYVARRADPCPNVDNTDGTGVVGLADLSLVLFHFGDTGAPGIPGDVDLDGDVDLADLSAVLFAFGTIPGC